jgi:hypothetical protein
VTVDGAAAAGTTVGEVAETVTPAELRSSEAGIRIEVEIAAQMEMEVEVNVKVELKAMVLEEMKEAIEEMREDVFAAT